MNDDAAVAADAGGNDDVADQEHVVAVMADADAVQQHVAPQWYEWWWWWSLTDDFRDERRC